MIIYDSIFDILNTYIYGAPDVLDSFQLLTLTQLSTLFSVFVVALPIIVIFMLVKFFVGSIARY